MVNVRGIKANLFQSIGFKTKKEGLTVARNVKSSRGEKVKGYLKRLKTYKNFEELKSLNSLVPKITTEKINEWVKPFNRYVSNDREILKKYRRVNTKTDIIVQGTDYSKDEDIRKPVVRILNRIVETHILDCLSILKDYRMVDVKVRVAYNRFPNTEFYTNNGVQIRQSFNILSPDVILDDDKYLLDEVTTFRIDPVSLRTKPGTIEKTVRAKFTSLQMAVPWAIVGYSVLPVRQGNLTLEPYLKRLQAYSPASECAQYHAATLCSTTRARLCIYETYYYLYVDATEERVIEPQIKKVLVNKVFANKKILSNMDEITNKLATETKEVQKLVKSGRLYEFLKVKSAEHNEKMYIEFFKKDITAGVWVLGDKYGELSEEDLCGNKVYLYHNEHVAPAISCTALKKYSQMQDGILKFYKHKLSTTVKQYNQLYELHGDSKITQECETEVLKWYKTVDNTKINEETGKPRGLAKDIEIVDVDGQKKILKANAYCKNFNNRNEIIKDELDKAKIKRSERFALKPVFKKQLEENEKIKVLGYDCETRTDDKGYSKVYSLCLSNGKYWYGDEKDIIKGFADYLDSIKTVSDDSKTHRKTKKEKILIYGFNNSRFDNLFIFDTLHTRNKSMKYLIMDNAIKCITYHNILIYDLNLYYQGSLSEIAKNFDLPIHKGVYPYKFANVAALDYVGAVPAVEYWNVETERDTYIAENGNTFNMREYTLKYCILDSKLVEQLAQQHLKQAVGCIEENGVKRYYDARFKSTGAGTAMSYFTQAYLNKTLYGSPDNIQLLERNAYKGGRTEVFKKSYNKEINGGEFMYYDINSSYPAAMRGLMPYEFVRVDNYGAILHVDNLIDHCMYEVEVTFNKCVIQDGVDVFIPNLLYRYNKNNEEKMKIITDDTQLTEKEKAKRIEQTRYSESSGDVIAVKKIPRSYHWGVELREAIENDPNVNIYCYKIVQYNGEEVFTKYSENLYKDRLSCKKTNPARAAFLKLLLNSLYGKTGQRNLPSYKMCSTAEQIADILSDTNNKYIDYEIIKDKVLVKYETNDFNKSVGNLVRFASYITAKARTNLSMFMRDVGHENVYYVDTDSCFTSKKPSEELISAKDLGKWKLETHEIQKRDDKKSDKKSDAEKIKIDQPCIIKRALFAAPKLYTYTVDVDDTKYEKIHECKAKGNPSRLVTIKTFDKLRAGETDTITNPTMFKRSLEGVIIQPQTRTVQEVLNKRIFTGNNSTPFADIKSWIQNKLK